MSGDAALFHLILGAGRPILMLHGGYLDHHHMLEEMEPAFEDVQGWRRVYVDLPGHGQSAAPPGVRTFDDILQVLLDFVDAVIPGERFAVAGMSAGGHLARGLVHRCPERLLGVMFNAAPMKVDRVERDLPDPRVLEETPDFIAAAGPEAEVLRSMAPVCDAALGGWARRNLAPARALLDREFALNSWEPENYAFSFPVHPLAQPFPAPSLILCGRQDTVAGYRDAWPLVEDYPRASFAVLDLGGHLIEPARPALFRALVADWLGRMAGPGQI